MKSLFVTSLFCAVMSLVAGVGMSAMTVVPHSQAASLQSATMVATVVFFIGWIVFAVWVRPGRRRVVLPPWLSRMLVAVGILYCVGVLLLTLG